VPFQLRHVEPLGVTRQVLRTALASGRIVALVPGVYLAGAALPAHPEQLHVLRAVAAQMRRAEAIASHATAALAWELPLPDPAGAASGPRHFTVPPGHGRRSLAGPDIRLAVRPLPPHHRAQHPCGLFLTTPARTAVDLAAGLDLPEALIVLDGAARLVLIDDVGASGLRRAYAEPRRLAAARRGLEEVVATTATRLSRRHLAAVVPLADPRRESALESRSYGHMVLAGLPLPDLQTQLETPLGTYYPDFLWPSVRLIGEADGMGKLKVTDDIRRQHQRQEHLREEMGYLFVRWTAEELTNRPAVVMSRIRARLDVLGHPDCT
jgi:very-short-patch-repair endonuclease